MKQIVMLVGIGNNDRGSARLASEFGRTVLVQDGPVGHNEIWEKGARTYNGPEIRIREPRLLSELTFGLPGLVRNIRSYHKLKEGKPCGLIITSAALAVSFLIPRPVAAEDLSRAVGVFLAYYLIRRGHDRGASLAETTREVAEMTRPIKQRRRYLDSPRSFQSLRSRRALGRKYLRRRFHQRLDGHRELLCPPLESCREALGRLHPDHDRRWDDLGQVEPGRRYHAAAVGRGKQRRPRLARR